MKILKTILKILGHLFLILCLTVATQIGGLIYWLVLLSIRIWEKRRSAVLKFWQRTAVFALTYLLFTLLLIPQIAPLFGRVAMPLLSHKDVKPNAHWIHLMNRHYVEPELRETVYKIAAQMQEKFPSTKLVYLDANFPFWDGFPLLPHLSHDDGEKLDLAFIYQEKNTKITKNGLTPSRLGYGICELPRKNEQNQAEICRKKGHWYYDILSRLLGRKTNYEVAEAPTISLVTHFAENPAIGKVFLEPHLRKRWGLTHLDRIRFHGCHAVRHDDHIHVQLKRN